MQITPRIPGLCLLFIFAAISALKGQAPGANKSAHKMVSPQVLGDLLNKPNGLAACANMVQHCSFTYHIFPIEAPDLATLNKVSSHIVIGTIDNRWSHLSDDGNYILTTYLLHPVKFVKGQPTTLIEFKLLGGYWEFPNGTSAEEKTATWEHLQVGKEYLVFLEKREDSLFRVSKDVDGLFAIPANGSQAVEPLAIHKGSGTHPVIEEVKHLTPLEFVNKLQALVASQPQ